MLLDNIFPYLFFKSAFLVIFKYHSIFNLRFDIELTIYALPLGSWILNLNDFAFHCRGKSTPQLIIAKTQFEIFFVFELSGWYDWRIDEQSITLTDFLYKVWQLNKYRRSITKNIHFLHIILQTIPCMSRGIS